MTASAESSLEVVLEWGSNTATYLNRLAAPTVEYEPVANSPRVGQDEQARINLPEDSPFDDGEPTAPIYVYVTELERNIGGGITRRVLFVGTVAWVDTNYQGRAGLTSLRCDRLIDRLDVPTGFTCDRECVWRVFNGGCGAVQGDHEQSGTIASIDGYTVEIPGLAAPDVTWARGYVEVDSLRLGIHTQTGDFFTLITPPPAAWDGASCLVVPGCRGTIEDCRAYDQEETYMGLGRSMSDVQNPTW